MRKTALIAAGLLVLSTAAMAGTAPAGDMAKDKAMAPAEKPMDKPMEKKMEKKSMAKWEHTTGEVTAVDATAKTLTVKAKAGDKNFKWDDKTVVSPKGATPAVGDHATVTTAKDSDMATKIVVHPAKKMAKPMEKPMDKPMDKH